MKKCKVREERNYDYRKLMKINDFPGSQPAGYKVRLSFYVLAPRDAHIIFAETESPNWTRDSAYEFRLYSILFSFCFFIGSQLIIFR